MVLFDHDETEFGTGEVRRTGNNHITPRLGYEHHEVSGRVMFTYGSDLATEFKQDKIYERDEDNELIRYKFTTSYKISIRPLIGLKVFLTKSLSITTETFLELGYKVYESVDHRYNVNDSSSKSGRGPELAVGPLGIFSINYHF